MLRNTMSPAGRRVLCLLLTVVLLTTMLPSVAAIPASFFNTHSDWHFDLTKEPDRAMTVEEYVALTTAYSYWSVGSGGETPRDKNGDLPSQWAAPYIRCETQKGALHPEELDYDAPATLAFIIKFTVNSKGLQGFNAVNLHYKFSGTENLTAEEKLCLYAAVDYSLINYTPYMDVSVTVPRRELEEKYKIPFGELQEPLPAVVNTDGYNYSMAFFEDCYVEYHKAVKQYETLLANSDKFNIVSMDTIYLIDERLAKKKIDSVYYNDGEYTREFVADYITHNYPIYKRDDPQLKTIKFCKEQGITILGGVFNWYDPSTIARMAANDDARHRAVAELLDITLEYDLDGLNLCIELGGNQYREFYSKLVRDLSAALHAEGRILMLTVGGYMRKADEQTMIYDYDVVSETADLISIVTYDGFSAVNYNAGGSFGPISNALYSERCLRYAATVFGPERILFGMASYAIKFNTTKHTAENITYDRAMELMAQHGATPQCTDAATDDSFFTYSENGENFIVYYESLEGIERRLLVPRKYKLGGVACFYLGSDNPTMFSMIGERIRRIPFQDVSLDSWYYDGVRFAYENKLFNGVTSTIFEPETDMTRAMLVTVLWRQAGKPAPEGSNPFQDVLEDFWYTDAITWAAENGVVNGVGNGKFEPDGKITREQMAAVLYRYCSKLGIDTGDRTDLNAFPDADKISGYAVENLSWAVAEGLITGSKNGGTIYLEPQGNATRAQVATVLMRFIRNILQQG